MVNSTSQVSAIPSDAIASLQTDGVLGPTIVAIDTRQSSEPPLVGNGVLRSMEYNLSKENTAHALEVMGNAMLKEVQKMREEALPPVSAPSK